MRIDIVTLFPEMFEGVLRESILRIAQEKGRVAIGLVNFREFGLGARRSVDDKPYGGGPGMVLACGPVYEAVEAAERRAGRAARRILLTPQGRRFDQRLAEELAREEYLLLVCGHYEGFDERIHLGLGALEVSVGDYVLSGGEIPAMAVVDAVVRLIPGVLGDEESARAESFTTGRLDHPQYTRPPEFRGMRVPEVLLSGNHQAIARWRTEQAENRTRERRADLLDGPGREGSEPPGDAKER